MIHHRRSIRLPNYDYTQPGAYFVTIVVKDRICLFGDVVDSEMQLSELGLLVDCEWNRIQKRFERVVLDVYGIMPDHFHGIIIINDPGRGTGVNPPRAPTPVEQFGKPVSGSIPTIVRSFKSSVTYQARARGMYPDGDIWQRNYYERVIRNEQELDRIRLYIQNNPLSWSINLRNRIK